MIYLYLFVSFLQVGMFSFWRWICGNAVDPGTGGDDPSLAGYIRIYRSGDNLTDDSGSNLNKLQQLLLELKLLGFREQL